MKKRILAGILAASLVVSVPAQGFGGIGGFIFRKFFANQAAEQVGNGARDFAQEFPKLDKVDRVITVGAVACLAYLGLEWLIKQSTKEVGFFDLLVGLGGLAGFKSPDAFVSGGGRTYIPGIQNNIDRGAKWWRTKFGGQDDQHYEDSAEKVSKGVNSIAEGLGSIFGTFKDNVNNVSENAKNVAQDAKNFAKGPQKSSEQKPSEPKQQQANPQNSNSAEQPKQAKEPASKPENNGDNGWVNWFGKKARGVANSFYNGFTSPEAK